MIKEPRWVCLECADDRGAMIPHGHCYTMHTGKCDLCRKIKAVTEPRDFGHTRVLLLLNDVHIELISLIADGLSTEEISKHMRYKVNTLSTYRARLMLSLGVKNAAELVSWAYRNKILTV